ncbi:MAG: MoaD/ThiS family protein [Gammaproteobacteria bacterium]
MSIQIKLFANLADAIGKRNGSVEYSEGLTVELLWQQFSGQDQIPEGVLCAVNFDYAEPDQLLNDGDEIAFFPPVTGG